MKSRRPSRFPGARIFSGEIHPTDDGGCLVHLIVNREMRDKIEYVKALARETIPGYDDSQFLALALKALVEREEARLRRTQHQ